MQFEAGSQVSSAELDIRDQISRKLLGASSMLLMMQGEGRRVFENLEEDWQEGYLEVLLDLTESARRLNRRRQ